MAVLAIAEDARKIYDAMRAGGVAIVPLDVAYAVFGMTADAIRTIYAAKGRSFTKPNGTLGNLDIFQEVHDVGQRERDVVSAVVEDYDLPLSVVAPFRAGSPFFAKTDPFCLERSTKAGTIDLLLNAGRLHDELARLSFENQTPIMGSSANRSLGGSKFRLQDIEPEVRQCAAVAVDYGLVRYNNREAISSTIIDLKTFEVHRFGVCYDQIRDILQRHFRIDLPPKPEGMLVRGAALGEMAPSA